MMEEYESFHCEKLEKYGQKGYYPVFLGETFKVAKNTYQVVQKLGYGSYSTVWLVENKSTKEYFALKITKCNEEYTKKGQEQFKMMKYLRWHETMVQWLRFLQRLNYRYGSKIKIELCRPLACYESFNQVSRFGKHFCTVIELMGPTLRSLIQHYSSRGQLAPLWLIKKISRQILTALVYLNEHAQVVHADLKPENIVIHMQPEDMNNYVESMRNYKVKPTSMKYLATFDERFRSQEPKRQEEKLKEGLQPISSIAKKEQGAVLQKSSVNEKEQKSQVEWLSSGIANVYLEKEKEDIQDMEAKKITKQPEVSVRHQRHERSERDERDERSERDVRGVSGVSGVRGLREEKDERGVTNERGMRGVANEKEEERQSVLSEEHSEDKTNKVDMTYLTWKNMSLKINDSLFFKIADLGNSCHINNNNVATAELVQTRCYRSPEILLGVNKVSKTDIFSMGCIIFELLTNEHLFQPYESLLRTYDNHHIFLIMETMGKIECADMGSNYLKFFDRKGKLHCGAPEQIKGFRYRLEKCGYSSQEVEEMEKFLTPMLIPNFYKRIKAEECVMKPWLWN